MTDDSGTPPPEPGNSIVPASSVTPVGPAVPGTAYAASQPTAMQLTPEESAWVAEMKGSVDVTDSQAVIHYGLPAQSKIAAFSDTLLGDIRAKDAEEAGDALAELLDKVRELDVEGLAKGSSGSRIPLVGRFVDSFRRFDKRYEKISTTVEKLLTGLERTRVGLLRDITALDKMYELNLDHLRQLDLYIIAGDQITQDLETRLVPALEAEAARSADPLIGQRLADLRQAAGRFERRLHDLKLTRIIAIQTAPQIRLIQGNDQSLVEKIQSSIANTIPLWKNQIAIALSLYRQQQALEVQRAVTDASNELLARNAELLRAGSANVAREAERGIVDIETLQKVNEDLIATLEEGIQIQEEGHARRLQTESELVKLQADLKRRLIELKGQPGSRPDRTLP
jgi:uncharacterized protein YaaN involved in tellurite resistance